MKNKLLTLGLATALLLNAGAVLNADAATPSKTLAVGDKFSLTGISAGKTPYVLQVVNADLNKDKKPELLYLVGNKPEKTSPYYDQLTYVLKDGKTGKWSSTLLKNEGNYNLEGYAPSVIVKDLNSDGQNDLLLSADTGGSGGMINYKLSTLKSGKWVDLLTKKDMAGLTVTGNYADQFKLDLYAKEIDKHFTIDLSSSKQMLIDSQVYSKEGKLLAPLEPYTSSLNYLEPVESYGMTMIKAEQRIVGIANADTVGRLQLMLHYENGAFKIKVVELVTTLSINF